MKILKPGTKKIPKGSTLVPVGYCLPTAAEIRFSNTAKNATATGAKSKKVKAIKRTLKASVAAAWKDANRRQAEAQAIAAYREARAKISGEDDGALELLFNLFDALREAGLSESEAREIVEDEAGAGTDMSPFFQ